MKLFSSCKNSERETVLEEGARTPGGMVGSRGECHYRGNDEEWD